MENNQVTITGVVSSEYVYSHTVYGEDFYKMDVAIARTSGTVDVLPVIVSERLFDVAEDLSGSLVKVTGEYRSYNQPTGEKTKLMLYVFAQEFEFIDEDDTSENNRVYLDGYICKSPTYRKTPLGREITDILVAVNRLYGKSDYIPCIAWGRSARWTERLEVGTRVQLYGRIESRGYIKIISEEECEQRVAYEVSISCIKEINGL